MVQYVEHNVIQMVVIFIMRSLGACECEALVLLGMPLNSVERDTDTLPSHFYQGGIMGWLNCVPPELMR